MSSLRIYNHIAVLIGVMIEIVSRLKASRSAGVTMNGEYDRQFPVHILRLMDEILPIDAVVFECPPLHRLVEIGASEHRYQGQQ